MYHIIVNPASKSGRGLQIWNDLESVLIRKKVPYDVIFSKRTGHVSQYVRELTARKDAANSVELTKFIILGGDGTLNETLQGIKNFSRTALGYIPTGSSNDMARDLKLPKNPLNILNIILAGKTHRYLDIGLLTYDSKNSNDEDMTRMEHYFAVSSGIGFDAAVCEEALTSGFKNALNKVGLGKLTYLIIALKQILSAPKIACNLYMDHSEPIHYRKFLFAAGMIHPYEGGGFKFCPGANPSDGLLDVCMVGNLPKPIILLALPTAFIGKHFMFPGIKHYSCTTLTIETSAPLWVHTDGEVTHKTRMLTMTCLKEKLHMLV